jgi:tetratricopeptide (TPR) repeat protein
MDSDDTIDPQNGAKLRELAYNTHDPSVMGYVMQVHCPHDSKGEPGDVTMVDHVKLVRKRPGIRFEGRIHEQILGSIRACGGLVGWTDIFVVHSGSDRSAEGITRKLERDIRLLRIEEMERPDHPFTQFNLGMTLLELNQPAEALVHLEKSLAVSGPLESHRRKAHALMVEAAMRVDDRRAAAGHLACGLEEFPDDPELLFRSGVLASCDGRLEEAIVAFERAIDAPRDSYFRSFDLGILSYKARQNLAAIFVKMNSLDRAAEQWRAIAEELPTKDSSWLGLAEVLFRQRAFDELHDLSQHLSSQSELRAVAHALQIRLRLERGDVLSAGRLLQEAVSEYPDDLTILEVRCRFEFDHGSLPDALAVQTELVHRSPQDAASRHNLGVLHMRMGNFEQAAAELREAIRLRPDHSASTFYLGDVLEQLGEHLAAREAWSIAARGSKDDPFRTAAIERLTEAGHISQSQSATIG